MKNQSYLYLKLYLALYIAALTTGRQLSEIQYRFTPCDMSERDGPSGMPMGIGRCTEYYEGIDSPITRDGLLFGFGGANSYRGAQGFRIPRDGLYNVTVAGAAGGRGVCNIAFGRAIVGSFQVELSTEYELMVAVGQKGLGPCDANPEHTLCQNPPTTFNETVNCNTTWYDFLYNGGSDNPDLAVSSGGGAGGGGASMTRLRNATDETLFSLPLVIAAGGGGSSAVLVYQTFSVVNVTVNLGDEEGYQEHLDGKPYRIDPYVSNAFDLLFLGSRGYKAVEGTLVAGAGGGTYFERGFSLAQEDGRPFDEAVDFAVGGLDCAQSVSLADIPLPGAVGGFGGGGGGCGGGGGGGGSTGGPVVADSNIVPGGGGYSVFVVDVPITFLDDSLNDGDGYVDIVLANCGCVHQCIVNTTAGEFECVCPNDTELAPDQNDCFQAVVIEVEPTPSANASPAGFQFVALSFSNQTLMYTIDAFLTVVSEESTRVRRQTESDLEEEACSILFVGENSEIVLTSNPIRESGRVTTLAEVTLETEGNGSFTISEYTDLLNSSKLVTGAILVSTGPCSVGDMVIRVNTSIQESDADPPDLIELRNNLTMNTDIVTAFARSVLQLQTEIAPTPTPSMSPPPPPPPSSDSGSESVVVIALTVSVVVFIVVIPILVGVFLGYKVYCQRKRKKQGDGMMMQEIPGIDLTGYVKVIRVEEDAGNSSVHSYEEVEGEEESETPQSSVQGFVYKYGVTAPVHDFSAFNRQRINTTINKWEYPRSNLIYMRVLGEGNFGKVLLMKAKGIAGYMGKIPVAVKTLSSRDPEVVRKFMDEAELMKKFSHPNIVSLLGVGAGSEEDEDSESAPLMILEYMPYGDLQNFLKSHRPEKGNGSCITEQHFYSFAVDVAKALEFLAANKYVHRDVAARNCLVGSGLQIKIADFGLSRGVYDKDYYRAALTGPLPVRWMSPESLQFGYFTSASDVWSYGVLLWEIVTYGKFPLATLKLQDIMDMASNGTLQHPRPPGCPDVIHEVMVWCHNHNRDERPTFTEILSAFSPRMSSQLQFHEHAELHVDEQGNGSCEQPLQSELLPERQSPNLEPPPERWFPNLEPPPERQSPNLELPLEDYEEAERYEQLQEYEKPDGYEQIQEYERLGGDEHSRIQDDCDDTQCYGKPDDYEKCQMYEKLQDYEKIQEYERLGVEEQRYKSEDYKEAKGHEKPGDYERVLEYERVQDYERVQNYERVQEYERIGGEEQSQRSQPQESEQD